MPRHVEQRFLPYQPAQVFDMVADVDRYPEFLPWCVATRVRERSDQRQVADMVVGFRMIREKFTSDVTLRRDDLEIDVRYTDGPFSHLTNRWRFVPHRDGSGRDGCLVHFYIDFEFRSAVLRKLMGALFNEAVGRMVAAFERRSHELFGAG